MRNLLLAAFAVLGLSWNAYGQDTVKLVNLDKPLPAEVKLRVGETVYFHRGNSEGVSKTVSSKSASLTESDRRSYPRLADSEVVAGYTAAFEGSGEVAVERAVVHPNAKPQVTKVKITVEPKRTVVDLDGKLPASIAMSVDEELQFTGKADFLDSNISDDKGGKSDVVKQLPSRINPPVFRATKPGACTFEFTYRSRPGGQVQTQAIKMTVNKPVVEVDLGAALPANLVMKVGTEIRFVSNVPGARQFNTATVNGADGKPSDGVEVMAVRRYPPAYEAKRAGTYTLTLSYRYHPKDPVQTHTINITVK